MQEAVLRARCDQSQVKKALIWLWKLIYHYENVLSQKYKDSNMDIIYDFVSVKTFINVILM